MKAGMHVVRKESGMLKIRIFCRCLCATSRSDVNFAKGQCQPGILTAEERNLVEKLPFFSNLYGEQSKKRAIVTKKQYIDQKVSSIKAIFGEDREYPGYISHHLPKSMSSPYFDAYCHDELKKLSGSHKNTKKPRLSVTKLLTKRWCELREAYDIYSNIGIFAHRRLLQGAASHEKLENQTHSISEQTQNLVRLLETDVPADEFHNFASLWFDNLIKMLSLFINGEAREVLCHSYLDSKSGILRSSNLPEENDILVSAIVDHLVLREKGSAHGSHHLVPFKFGGEVIDAIDEDILQNLTQLQEKRKALRSRFEIVVSDVKTRSIRRIPNQENVVNAAKLQVMYYRYFLEQLAIDPVSTYSKLLINAERRGFDVDQPIHPSKVFIFMARDKSIAADMRRLRDGSPIGFSPFDKLPSGRTTYDMSQYHFKGTEENLIQTFDEFFTRWAKPPTLRYLASRLSQIYHEVGSLLSDTLMVEYYVNDESFHNMVFKYSVEHLKKNSYESAAFWLGKRDIEPIEPSIKNMSTYCKFCDYQAVCSWKKIGTEKCRELGEDLSEIDKSFRT